MAAAWIVNIPAIAQRTHVSKGILGIDLVVFGIGAVVSMQVSGHLIDRLGSRTIAIAGGLLLVIGINLPGLATDGVTLAGALFIAGIGNGALDLAINDQGVLVEREYPRPIMSSFHAFYSVGGAAGAVFGSLTQLAELNVQVSLLIASVIGAALIPFFAPRLVPRPAGHPAADPLADAVGSSDPSLRRALVRRVVILAALAFALMLAEGVANDWSALQAIERLHESRAAASLAYGVFALCMTIGRLSADRIAHSFGAVRVVRFGTAIAAIGMLVVISSGTYPLTLVGWALFGIGLSGVAPQIFSAAGNMGAVGRGVVLSRVVSSAYVGQLVGPGLIGWIAGAVGLTTAFLIPFALLVVGVFAAGSIATRSAPGPRHPRRARLEP
jgi:MFS family permease